MLTSFKVGHFSELYNAFIRNVVWYLVLCTYEKFKPCLWEVSHFQIFKILTVKAFVIDNTAKTGGYPLVLLP